MLITILAKNNMYKSIYNYTTEQYEISALLCKEIMDSIRKENPKYKVEYQMSCETNINRLYWRVAYNNKIIHGAVLLNGDGNTEPGIYIANRTPGTHYDEMLYCMEDPNLIEKIIKITNNILCES